MNLIGGVRVWVALGDPVDARIRAITTRQHARVSRAQLLAAGVDANVIKRRLRTGRLIAHHRGVYGLPETEEIPLEAEAAALLACGGEAALSHHSAAVLWQLRAGDARPVHVTVLGSRGFPELIGVSVHRSRTITRADLGIHEGLRVTSPARTLLDVSPNLTDRDIERMLDEGLFARRILTLADVDDVLGRAGSHPGRARLARAAKNHTGPTRTESPPEERLLALIRAARLPEPRLQTHVLGYRLDFFWPELRLAVEVDAYGTHGSRARFQADRRRDARLLTEKGIFVVRLTDAMIDDRPFEVIGLLARAIGQQEARARGAW